MLSRVLTKREINFPAELNEVSSWILIAPSKSSMRRLIGYKGREQKRGSEPFLWEMVLKMLVPRA